MEKLERFLTIVERVINLIRPKFYNRLTWAAVIAGLFLMASPWWADLLIAAAGKFFEMKIPSTESHMAWGFGLVALGLVYHLLVHYISELVLGQRNFQELAEQRAHDRENFQALAAVLSESDLAWILRDLQDQHAYVSAQGRKLDDACSFLLAPSTQFIDKEVQEAARNLGGSLKELRNWISLNFFVYGDEVESGHRFCLYPELNMDRSSTFPTLDDQRKYEKFSGQLDKILGMVDEKYGYFRMTVKRVLAV